MVTCFIIHVICREIIDICQNTMIHIILNNMIGYGTGRSPLFTADWTSQIHVHAAVLHNWPLMHVVPSCFLR